MKRTKKDFVTRCNEVVSKYNPSPDTRGGHVVKCRFGDLHIHPFDGECNPWIALRFGSGPTPVGCWGSFNPHSWKWNIFFSGGNSRAELENLSLTELEKRLKWATE